jgi:NADH-quinone oxidoreductase subunit E/NADP-reducing hydrogenase subunit HndA
MSSECRVQCAEVEELFSERIAELDKFIDENPDPVDPQGSLILVLHKAQDLFGFLPREVMDHVADRLMVPAADVYGVATFYSYFTLEPRGKYPVSVCMGTACYVKGAPAILGTVEEQLQIKTGQTTEDGLFSLVECRCIGACGLAPVITIGKDVYGRLTADQVPEILAKYRQDG